MRHVIFLRNILLIAAATILLSWILFLKLCVAASIIAIDTADNYTTAFANSKKITQDSDGNLYVAYHRYNLESSLPWNVVNVAKSSDEGLTWTDITGPLNESIIYEQNNPTIAIDASDNLHMVCRRDFRLTYYKYNGLSWTPPEVLTASEFASNSAPSMAIDRLDNIHVVDNQRDTAGVMQVVYYKFDGIVWSGPTYITNEDSDQHVPCLEIDVMNRLHVAWSGRSQTSAYKQIRYANYANGS